MPRPRHDLGEVPAKQRMEDAFWDLLREREYHKIPVTEIVRRATVNRNSFYYHYRGMPELADSAILHVVQTMKPPGEGSEAHTACTWRNGAEKILRSPEQRRRLDRLTLLAGPHGSPELLESLRDFCRLTMLSTMKLDPSKIDLRTDLLVDFTVGGLLAVLRRWPELSKATGADSLLDQDVAALTMGMFLSMSGADMSDCWRRIFTSGTAD